jgi:7-keto-8-aminopelargonate synthetase-like enzyme
LAGRAVQLPHAAASAKKYWILPSISIAIRVAVGTILVVAAPVEKSLGSMAGGLIIGASAVPTFFRAWKARFLASQNDRTLPEGLTDRILDMEQAHRDQIADLEERIDFAERMLAKQREQQIGPG